MDFSLEVVTIPVSDVERAKQFYAKLGWRLDIDFSAPGGFRVIQFTPPGSACSIALGNGITTAAPGSMQGLELAASYIAAARADIASRGIAISDIIDEANSLIAPQPRAGCLDPIQKAGATSRLPTSQTRREHVAPGGGTQCAGTIISIAVALSALRP